MDYIKSFEEFINESLNESETYNDYPAAVKNAAKKALDWKEKYGKEVDAGTPVGWKRANQLASGENISIDTITRMKAFFDRHDGNQTIDSKHKNEPWKDNGHVAWLLWGGDPGRKWAEDKLKEIESKNESLVEMSISSRTKGVIKGIFSEWMANKKYLDTDESSAIKAALNTLDLDDDKELCALLNK